MNRLALFVFSLIGALVLVYTASFYAGSDPLALGITVAIAISSSAVTPMVGGSMGVTS